MGRRKRCPSGNSAITSTGESARFASKDKHIVAAISGRVVPLPAARRDGEQAPARQGRFAARPVRVPEDACELVIIEAGTLERTVFPAKAKRFNEMQFAPGIGAEADDVARVRRNFRLEQDHSDQG